VGEEEKGSHRATSAPLFERDSILLCLCTETKEKNARFVLHSFSLGEKKKKGVWSPARLFLKKPGTNLHRTRNKRKKKKKAEDLKSAVPLMGEGKGEKRAGGTLRLHFFLFRFPERKSQGGGEKKKKNNQADKFPILGILLLAPPPYLIWGK